MTIRAAKDMVSEAGDGVVTLTGEEAAGLAGDPGVVFVDVREAAELQASGQVAGSVHAPRGLLEFHADPSGPYHKAEFDPARRLVVYCASGGRSTLAARTLTQMGYPDVAHVAGGFAALQKAGVPTTKP